MSNCKKLDHILINNEIWYGVITTKVFISVFQIIISFLNIRLARYGSNNLFNQIKAYSVSTCDIYGSYLHLFTIQFLEP